MQWTELTVALGTSKVVKECELPTEKLQTARLRKVGRLRRLAHSYPATYRGTLISHGHDNIPTRRCITHIEEIEIGTVYDRKRSTSGKEKGG